MNSIPAGIQKLHQQDIDATVSMDVGKLTDLWADDGVLLGQGAEALVGKPAIEASLKQNFAANPTMKVLKYVPQIADLKVVGDVAYEWGSFEATHQISADSSPVSFQARFLRVMKLQSDGSWKFVRVMWNTGSR
ncbi:MAG TPA: nuclear transport factor 2 family protein [Terriglobia bacterium]|nr:nuclear transport factor 2 family protein [Terriglobia bacterium]